MHMHDHSSNGFNAYHMEHRHGASEEWELKMLEILTANTRVLERWTEQMSMLTEVMTKR